MTTTPAVRDTETPPRPPVALREVLLSRNVDAVFFVAATRWLTRRHGDRTFDDRCAESTNDYLGALAAVEAAWCRLPVEVPRATDESQEVADGQ